MVCLQLRNVRPAQLRNVRPANHDLGRYATNVHTGAADDSATFLDGFYCSGKGARAGADDGNPQFAVTGIFFDAAISSLHTSAIAF